MNTLLWLLACGGFFWFGFFLAALLKASSEADQQLEKEQAYGQGWRDAFDQMQTAFLGTGTRGWH
jgi:hypothetical protein